MEHLGSSDGGGPQRSRGDHDPRVRRRRRLTLALLAMAGVLIVAAVLTGVSGGSPTDRVALDGEPTDGDGAASGATTRDDTRDGTPDDGTGDGTGDTSTGAAPEAGSRAGADRSVGPLATGWTVAVSAPRGIPDDLGDALLEVSGVRAAATVRGATLGLVATTSGDGEVVDTLPEGWRYPVEVLAVDPEAYAAVLAAAAHDAAAADGADDPAAEVASAVALLTALGPGDAVLSESSAQVRGVDIGARLRFQTGTELTVIGVLPDAQVGAAEILISTAAPLPVPTARYALATLDAPVTPAQRARLTALGGDRAVLDSGDQVPVLRHAAGVMPPARRKAHFGEFAITDGPGRWVQQGATWLREVYEEQEVPLLGLAECHREMFPPLIAAMEELIDEGLDHLVDGDDFGGCWAPRTAGSEAMSSHAWGIAVDFNVQGNHYGMVPTMPLEIVEVMARHGFAWGGEWPIPDGMHFELVVDRELPPPA